MEMAEVCNVPDDTNFYTWDFDLKILMTRLEYDAAIPHIVI